MDNDEEGEGGVEDGGDDICAGGRLCCLEGKVDDTQKRSLDTPFRC